MQAALVSTGSKTQTAWRALGYYACYRVIVALLFMVLAWIGELPEPLGSFRPALFRVAASAYFAISLVVWAPLLTKKPNYLLQVTGQVFLDIGAFTLMMYASAGVSSGFGMLLMIAVAAGSLLCPGRLGILFAAMATICVLGQEAYATLVRVFPEPNYPHAGFLGFTFFIIAFIAQALARRVRESEALAERRAVDLANLARLNEHIVQHMQSGIVVLDGEQRARLLNTAARRLLGVQRDIRGMVLSQAAPELATALEWWRSNGENPGIIRPAGSEVDVQVSFRALNPGSQPGTLIFLEDASLLGQRAQQMKLASLGRLAASIAHEVRNPLGAISHAGQLLSESPTISAEDQRLTRIIRDQSQRVNVIIENVMRISRREPATPRNIRISEWLEQFAVDFSQQKSLGNGALQWSVEPPDMEVRMDPSQLQQVLWNLCDNAIRYSRGTPLVELRGGIRDQTQRPYLDVIDHGPGMSAEVAEHLFEPFMTTEMNGSGLGLYIARELCEANQAALSLHRNSVDGCQFRISFPYPVRQELPA